MAPDSGMNEINATKNLKFLESLFSLVKDNRDFTQDILLESMIQNESSEKLSSSINNLSSEIKTGFKDLSFSIKEQSKLQKLYGDDVIEASYVNLTEDSIKNLVDASAEKTSIVDEIDWTPKVSDSIYELLDVSKQTRDLMIRENTLPATMTDLESTSSIYYQKSMYYLESIKSSNELMLDLMRDKKSSYATSEATDMGNKKEKPGILDSLLGSAEGILEFLGLGAIIGKMKKFTQFIIEGLDKLLKPVTEVVEKGIGFIIGKAKGIVESLFESLMNTKVMKALVESKAGKVLASAVEHIMPLLKPFAGVFKGIGKLMGSLSTGGILTAAFALFDFTTGIQEAGEIVGKDKEKLSLGEKIMAGLSKVISGLFTLGLVDPKYIYKAMDFLGKQFADSYKALMAMFPPGVKKAVEDIWDKLFDRKKGIFGPVIEELDKIVKMIESGNYLGALKEAFINFFTPIGAIKSIGEKVGQMFSEGLAALNAKDMLNSSKEMLSTIVKKVSDIIVEMVTSMLSMLPSGLGGDLKKSASQAWETTKGYGSKVASWFGGSDTTQPVQKVASKPIVPNVQTAQGLQSQTPIQAATAVAMPIKTDAGKTVSLTQDKENKNNNVQVTTPAPIVNVQAPAPQPKVERKQRAGTETVIFMNSALGRS